METAASEQFFTVMKAIVFYLLIQQKNIKSKQNTLKPKYLLCLENLLKDFSVNKMKKRGLAWCVYGFFFFYFFHYRNFDIIDTTYTDRYLLKKKNDIKII